MSPTRTTPPEPPQEPFKTSYEMGYGTWSIHDARGLPILRLMEGQFDDSTEAALMDLLTAALPTLIAQARHEAPRRRAALAGPLAHFDPRPLAPPINHPLNGPLNPPAPYPSCPPQPPPFF